MAEELIDRKIYQDEANELMAPMELDLLAVFKLLENDTLEMMDEYEGTADQLINDVLSQLSEPGGEEVLYKSNQIKDDLLKALPTGTRRKRKDGTYEKQESGKWVKVKEEKNKTLELSNKAKDVKNKIDNLERGSALKINDKITIKHGYNDDSRYTMIINHGRTFVTFPNSEVMAKYISGDIKDIEYQKPKIKKDKKIGIVDIGDSDYQGQDMKWTETYNHSEILKKDLIAYHYSDNEIKNFAEKETCFFPDPYNYTETGYQIKIPAGTKVKWYDSGELRVVLDKNMEINQLEEGWSEYNEIK